MHGKIKILLTYSFFVCAMTTCNKRKGEFDSSIQPNTNKITDQLELNIESEIDKDEQFLLLIVTLSNISDVEDLVVGIPGGIKENILLCNKKDEVLFPSSISSGEFVTYSSYQALFLNAQSSKIFEFKFKRSNEERKSGKKNVLLRAELSLYVSNFNIGIASKAHLFQIIYNSINMI